MTSPTIWPPSRKLAEVSPASVVGRGEVGELDIAPSAKPRPAITSATAATTTHRLAVGGRRTKPLREAELEAEGRLERGRELHQRVGNRGELVELHAAPWAGLEVGQCVGAASSGQGPERELGERLANYGALW
jgi:hypothetical protein